MTLSKRSPGRKEIFGWSALRRTRIPEIRALAVGSALGLASVDIVYSTKRTISKIYLLDALLEVVLVGTWLKSEIVDGYGGT